MIQDSNHNVVPVQEAHEKPTPAPVALPDLADVRYLPPLLQNTVALEAMLTKAAGQLN
jgi:hypothetical protein